MIFIASGIVPRAARGMESSKQPDRPPIRLLEGSQRFLSAPLTTPRSQPCQSPPQFTHLRSQRGGLCGAGAHASGACIRRAKRSCQRHRQPGGGHFERERLGGDGRSHRQHRPDSVPPVGRYCFRSRHHGRRWRLHAVGRECLPGLDRHQLARIGGPSGGHSERLPHPAPTLTTWLGTTATIAPSAGQTVVWNGAIFDSDVAAALIVNGGGTLALGNASNSYGAGTIVTGNSTLSVSDDLALGSLSGSVALGGASSGERSRSRPRELSRRRD